MIEADRARRVFNRVKNNRAFYRKQAVRAERRLGRAIIEEMQQELPPAKATVGNRCLWDVIVSIC